MDIKASVGKLRDLNCAMEAEREKLESLITSTISDEFDLDVTTHINSFQDFLEGEISKGDGTILEFTITDKGIQLFNGEHPKENTEIFNRLNVLFGEGK